MNDCASCLDRKQPIAGVKSGTFCSEGCALTPCATRTIEMTLRKDYHSCVTDYKPVSTKKKKNKKRIVLSDNAASDKKHTRCSKKPHVIAAAVLIYVSTKLFRRNIFCASC